MENPEVRSQGEEAGIDGEQQTRRPAGGARVRIQGTVR